MDPASSIAGRGEVALRGPAPSLRPVQVETHGAATTARRDLRGQDKRRGPEQKAGTGAKGGDWGGAGRGGACVWPVARATGRALPSH